MDDPLYAKYGPQDVPKIKDYLVRIIKNSNTHTQKSSKPSSEFVLQKQTKEKKKREWKKYLYQFGLWRFDAQVPLHASAALISQWSYPFQRFASNTAKKN